MSKGVRIIGGEVSFGSMEWLDMYVDIFNSSPEVVEALKDLTAKVAYEFTDRPDLKPKFVDIREGKIENHGEVEDETEMDYIIKGNYDVWKAMTLGELDPMNALMARKISVRGNMAALLKHAEGFKKTFDVVQKIPTVFD